jgi:septal ring factor EnvC (AmiA/AmiB activator)
MAARPHPESGIRLFALGRNRCADSFEEEKDPKVRAALLDAHILMSEAKHFKNLHLHESRLRRQYKQDAQELRELQERRKEQEQKETEARLPLPEKKAAHASANGFEFTNSVESGREEKHGTNHPSNAPATLRAGSV